MTKRKRHNPARKGRSLQRQKALDVLYEADLRQINVADLLEERKTVSTAAVPIGDYGITIVQTYADAAGDVDSMIEASSPDWSVARMSTVDRNLLRIGATEIMFLGVDVPIIVSEIASLARDVSADSAVRFTMGVLNRIGQIREEETAGQGVTVETLPLPDSTESGENDDEATAAVEDETTTGTVANEDGADKENNAPNHDAAKN